MTFQQCVAAVLVASSAQAEPFSTTVEHLTVDGEVRQVDAVDLDGDGSLELVATVFKGAGSSVRRSWAVFWKTPGGAYAAVPDLVLEPASDVCAFDFANVDERPGDELIELTAAGVRARTFTGKVVGAPTTVVTEANVFVRAAKGELPRLRLFQPLGERLPQALLLPSSTGLSVYARDGASFTKRAHLAFEVGQAIGVPRRSRTEQLNRGLPAFSVTTQFPEVRVVELNGDQWPDLALVEDETIRGYFQTETGFAAAPSLEHTFALRTPKEIDEHASITVTLADLDGDRRADAVLTKHVSKGISSAKTTVAVYGATSEGFPAKADQLIETDGASVAAVQLADITGDGRPDLLVPSVQMGLFAIIRVLTSSSMRVDFHLHALAATGRRFAPKPTASRDLSFQLNLNENNSDLQAVDMSGDFDGDGHLDLAFGVGRDELALYRGGKANELFSADPVATVAVRAFGHAITAPLDGGARSALVLWYPETKGHQHELSIVRLKGAPQP
jgi:FG-GAP-like repeat